MNNSNTLPKSPGRIAFENHKMLAITICVLASFFYIYDFFLRTVPAAISQELMRDFSMDARSFGIMSAFFFYAYTAMQIPAGLLLDRFGPRILLTVSVGICAIATLLFGVTHSVAVLSFSRFMVGFVSSFAYIGALLLATRWLPAKYFALVAGLVQAMGCLGAIISEAPVAFLAEHFGWRQSLYWSGALGVVLTILFWLIIRDHPPTAIKVKSAHASAHGEMSRLHVILKNPQTWFAAIAEFSAWAPVSAFAALWGIPFLMSEYHTNAITASAATSIIWLAIAIGGPLMGWWSDKIYSRRIPLISSSALALAASLGVIYTPHPPWWLMDIFLFLFGIAASAQAVTFGIVKDIHHPSVAGTGVGFNNMAAVLGGVILQPVIGIILRHCWTGGTLHGAPVYSVDCYEKAFIFIPLCGLLGLINAFFFIKETHCQIQYDK